MRGSRALRTATALLLVAGVAGCGLGAGGGSTESRVLVTRDFGARELGARISQSTPSSETVMALLERSFEVTAHGGGVVRSIDGLAGGRAGGRSVDWFFYVNGVENESDAAEVQLHSGDRVWWDRHDSGAAPHVPAVVGSFPEPFLHGTDGKRYPVVLECADDVSQACTEVSDRLGAAGVIAGRQTLGTGVGEKTVRVFVGRWSTLRGDAALEQLDHGPVSSGVFAQFTAGGSRLELLDQQGAAVRTLGAGAGLVAATRFEQQAPTWAITGTDVAGVEAAARRLDEQQLQRHFALAVSGPSAIGLPTPR
jgi:hypothetical protein